MICTRKYFLKFKYCEPKKLVAYSKPIFLHSRIKYQDYTQNGEAIFGNANMGEHKHGVIYVKKLM